MFRITDRVCYSESTN